MDKFIEKCSVQSGVYTTFKQQLLTSTHGTIKWRYTNEGKDICVMNDINSINGHLLPNSFVHVSCEMFESGPVIKCTCEIYKFLQHFANEQYIGDDKELDIETSCMHCRFFNEHLLNAYERITEGQHTNSRPLQIVNQSLQYMNADVLLLGEALKNGCTKFSVVGQNYFALVTLTFLYGKGYLKCHAGMCAASRVNKKRIPRTAVLSQLDKMCPHLVTCYQNIDAITQHFPEYFTGENQTEDTDDEIPNNMGLINDEDDANLDEELSGNFDKQEGLWTYKSLSKHKPTQMENDGLIASTRERIRLIVEGIEPNPTFEMKPNVENKDGTFKNCSCSEPFTESGLIHAGTGKLFTRVGVLTLKYYSIICEKKKCTISYEDLAKEANIFFYSKNICAGDEIGWDFISAVKASKISFTSFCTQMTRQYRTTHKDAEPFMSLKTFIGWFFGWLSSFRIDFRKHIDPFCGHDPTILACDGTHIGVSVKHLNLDKAVTRNDVDEIIPNAHIRYDRTLFSEEFVRIHMKYMSKKYMKSLKEENILPEDQENAQSIRVLNTLGHDPRLKMFIHPFLFNSGQSKFLEVQAELMLQLSGDAAIMDVIPHRCLNLLREICSKVEQNMECKKQLGDMRKYNAQVSDLVWLSMERGSTVNIVNFLLYLVDRIESLHRNDLDPLQIEEIANRYDPRLGVAYYFTQNGNQIRKLPRYEKSLEKAKKEPPPLDGPCTKKYPKVSYGGFSYMLLWFCPVHGHSYGFHLIEGGEGPKDVMSSLLKFKPTMPQELFYDNACNLSQYCYN